MTSSRARARWWLPVVVVVAAACTTRSPGPGIDGARALGHAGALVAIGPRPGDSAASRAAAAYIERALTAAGAAVERLPVGVVDLPPITVMGRSYRRARRVETTDPDLVVRFGPPGKLLLIMAHYDTVPGSPGAVDDAAAVGVLIELARSLGRTAPATGVMLAFTANEELGLVGAEALAARIGDDVEVAIALDLIGGSGALSLNGASELIGAPELRWLAAAADRAGVVVRAPLVHRVVSRWWPQAERADHGAFTRRQIRAVHFYDRGQDGEWIDLAYHRPGDVLARVDRASVDEVGRLLVALVGVAPPAPGGDGLWLPVAHNTVIPRWPVVAIELALVVAALGLLLSLRTRSVRGGLGAVAALACFAIAAVATTAVERATAGDHPAPWLHAPLRTELAELLVLAGTLGILVLVARRFRPWIGERRYLAIAVGLLLAIGVGLLVMGAAELAWIWLVPAAITALGPRLGPARLLAVLAPALPAALVLAPNQLREAAWNGLLPLGIPLAVWLAVFSLPVAAGVGWGLRHRGRVGPLGAFVLPVGCLLSVLAGVILMSRAHPACGAPDFNQFHLACERGP